MADVTPQINSPVSRRRKDFICEALLTDADASRTRDNGYGGRARAGNTDGANEPSQEDDGGWGGGPVSSEIAGNRGAVDDGWGSGAAGGDAGRKGEDAAGGARGGKDVVEAEMQSEGGASGLISNDFQVEVCHCEPVQQMVVEADVLTDFRSNLRISKRMHHLHSIR